MKQSHHRRYNPSNAIRTNVFGAENVVSACLRTGVKRVVALSTDKAANPINLYGASSWRPTDFVAANNLAGAEGARFSGRAATAMCSARAAAWCLSSTS